MRTLAITVLLILSLTSSQAQKINTDLVYLVNEPLKKTNRPPVLIMLHGYGANEEDLFELAKTLDPRLMVFSLRGNFPQNNGGYCWYQLSIAPDGKFNYDYSEVKQSKAKIISFISQVCKEYKLDSTQVFIMGFSQGAIMSYELAATVPGKIKGILALSGRLMEETKQLKTDWNKLVTLKCFIAHGLSDNVIKKEEADKALAFLKEKKLTDLSFHSYEMPHSISGAELNDIRSWLSKAIVSPKPAASSK